MTARVGDTLDSGSAALPPTAFPPSAGGIGAADSALPDPTALARQKAELRKTLRRSRVAIPLAQRRGGARQAARQLLGRRGVNRARDVAVYLSVRSELSTAPLIARLLQRGCRLWAPLTLGGGRMRFAPLRPQGSLRRGALGLPQPARARPLRTARQMDLVLVPLLGFDARGRRLGNGGGYYDRALAGAHHGRRPWLVGYAFAAQEVRQVPAEPWDVRLDAVVTERGMRRCR